MTKRLQTRSERGQMLAIMAVSIVALCAMGAFVMDAGSWFRAHRATQTVADAAALAGAQMLPLSTSDATTVAQAYGTKNGGGVTQIQFSSNTFPNDTISVTAQRVAPGFLSKVLGISSVNVKANAAARAWNLGSAKYAGPFAVDKAHPMLSGGGCPCFNQPTTLDLKKIGPGAFRIVNIDGSHGGTGQQVLSDWINKGYNGYMGVGWYYSDPGAKFNPGPIEDAITARIGSEVLFPVYDAVRAQGAGFDYRVVGWVGFKISGFDGQGNNSVLFGEFTRVIWEGITSESGDNFFGATVVKLVG
jgi:Putative Flp pilus-assembly TadE/G-like